MSMNPADAEAAVKEAEKSGRKDAGVVEALTNLVNLYVHQSRYAEAEPLKPASARSRRDCRPGWILQRPTVPSCYSHNRVMSDHPHTYFSLRIFMCLSPAASTPSAAADSHKGERQ